LAKRHIKQAFLGISGIFSFLVISVSQYPLHLFFKLIYSNYFKNVKYGYNKLVVKLVVINEPDLKCKLEMCFENT
jgi:hypothetical protein